VGNHDSAYFLGFGDLSNPFSQLPESVRSEMARRNHGPILDSIRADPLEPFGEPDQGFPSMGWDVSPSPLVTLHRDRAAGEEEMDHSDTKA
jgi:hypothetical protein